MKVTLSHLEYQEENKRVLATVTYNEKVGEVYHSAKVTVFVEWTDSYEELKRQALLKAQDFLSQCASAH